MAGKKRKLLAIPVKIPFWTGEARAQHRAIKKEKVEIQSRNRSPTTRPPRYRPASSRTHNYGEAFEEAQTQEKVRGFSSRRLRDLGRLSRCACFSVVQASPSVNVTRTAIANAWLTRLLEYSEPFAGIGR